MYAVILVLSLLSVVVADKHVLIVAPRDAWIDYGVQSETCRMYKDIIAGGVKPENIILMSTHNVPDMEENPFPGNLYTDDSPDAPGKDYAHGCIEFIDYEAEFMTGDVFLAILRGDTDKLKELTGMENPRALKSTEEDELMLYFSSHGGPGRVVVGETRVSDTELLDTIKYMHEQKMYKHFFIMMEACYSGSMFTHLPKDLNVFAMTAANDEYSSYESHCPPHDDVDGKHIGACLSCYWDNSIQWFIEGNSGVTLNAVHHHAYDDVCHAGAVQFPSEYGDIEGIGSMKIRDFMGEIPAGNGHKKVDENDVPIAKADVPTHLAKWRAIRASKEESARALAAYEKRVHLEAKREVEVMRLGAAILNERVANKALHTAAKVFSPSCVSELAEALVVKCGHTYPMKETTVNMLKNICLPGFNAVDLDFSEICL